MFAQIVCPWGTPYLHAQSERFNLNALIQSQEATRDVNEMKSLSLIGPQWEHRSHTQRCFSGDIFLFPQGQLDYQLQDQDNIVFISTLHGG